MKLFAYAILVAIFGCAAVVPPPVDEPPVRRECQGKITRPLRPCARPNCCGCCDKEDLCCCWHGIDKCTCAKPKDPSR